MDLSVNGQYCKIPPGFRFHPTEEELLQYYLKKKVAQVIIELDVIPCVDLNKLEPWDIQETCKIGSGPQNEWYFFSRKDKKYPSGTRTNRATETGFWKATGRDKIVYNNSKRIGLRKTLVFYLGRAPAGKKSDWIMYEYRLEDNSTDDANNAYNFGEFKAENWWVICRLFKKRNFIVKERPQYSSTSSNTSNGQPQFFSSQKVKHNLQENTTQNSNRSTIIGDENNELKPSIRLISSNVDNDQDQRSEGCDYAVDNILRGFHYSNSLDPFINQENERIRDFDFSQCVHNLQMPIMPYLFPSTPYQESEVYSSNDDLWSLLDNLI